MCQRETGPETHTHALRTTVRPTCKKPERTFRLTLSSFPIQTSGQKGNYTCDCPLGYTGRHCESLASLCANNPCTNGGTCIQGPSGYLCICPPGDLDEKNNCRRFTGCHEKPCRNGKKNKKKKAAPPPDVICSQPTAVFSLFPLSLSLLISPSLPE